MDPISAMATASAAFFALKKGFAIGRDLESMASDLSRWMGALSDLDQAEKEARNPPIFKKLFAGQSVEQEAITAFANKQKAEQQRYELKQWISLTLGRSKWEELVKMEGQIRKRRKETLYRQRERRRKYVATFGHRGGARFTFGRQVHDNMFWSLASGVPIWTGYEVLLLWTHANGATPAISFDANPALVIGLVLFTGPWVAFHFYWGHRLLHTGPLYRHVHALHHRNVNIGPWSGISMHPVEHCIYFSSLLVHLVVPSHPVLVMFHGYMLALSAIFGHTGFHELLLGRSRRMIIGHFHHQLHHRYFECNYGSVDFPLDVWFGTFHDGIKAARQRLKERLGPR